MSLKEITSRKKGSDFFEKDYTISKSMLKKVIKANGAVIIDDADTSAESTVSMRDFNIKSIVCLPLILHDKEKNPIESIDIYHKPYIFDGSKITHSVEEFEGERWSAVFYSN